MSDGYAKTIAAFLGVIAAGVVMAALVYTSSVVIPFVISVFIYMVVSPLVAFLQKRFKVPRLVSALMAVAVFLAGFAVLIVMVTASVGDFVEGAEVYKQKLVEFVNKGSGLLKKYELEVTGQEIRDALKNLPVLDWTKGLTGGAFSFFGNSALVILIVVFLLVGKSPEESKNPLMEEISRSVFRYLSAKLIVSLATGVLVGILLYITDVELALMFAILTILMNFIPSIGSIMATVLPLPVLILQFGFGWQLYVVLGISSVIQFVLGNVIEPKMMGQSLDMHPVTVIMSLLFWGLLWGMPGLLLGVPITVIIKIILGHIESTKPIAEILAGRLPGGVEA